MVAIAGSLVGAALVVTALMVVLYTGVSWWVGGWMGACGLTLVSSGLWAWQRPRDVTSALTLGTVAAIAGVGSSAPAFRVWIQLGPFDPEAGRVEVAVVGVTLGILCACYLAFMAAELVRGERCRVRGPS